MTIRSFFALFSLMALLALLAPATSAAAETAPAPGMAMGDHPRLNIQEGPFLSDDPESRLSTIPHNPEVEAALLDSGIGLIAVRHDGWNETLATWSRLKIHELTGRTSIKGQAPLMTVLSLIYEPNRWYYAKFLPLEDPRIAEILELEGHWISPGDVIDNAMLDTLQAELVAAAEREQERTALKEVLDTVHQIRTIGPGKPGVFTTVTPQEVDANEVRRLVEDTQAREEAHARLRELTKTVNGEKHFLDKGSILIDRTSMWFALGEQFYITPDVADDNGDWIAAQTARRLSERMGPGMDAPGPELIQPASNAGDAAGFVKNALQMPLINSAANLERQLTALFTTGNPRELPREQVDAFLAMMQRSDLYPSEAYRVQKNFYVHFSPTRKSAWVYGIAAALFGLFFFFQKRPWYWSAVGVLIAAFALHTLGQVLRIFLTGHMPVSNMYESIVFASWSALAIGIGLELWKRNGVVGVFAAIIGLLALMGVSLMPLHDTRLHPLRAVLNSYWLNIHVTAMLISYGAFMVATIFAAAYLIKSYAGRDPLFGKTSLMPMEQMEQFAYRLVQLGWPILTVGIALGAVWADTAWGRFWGWDPKETWALITWITYTIYLHSRMVMGWKGRISAIACVVGFVMVMITWLGVSYLPWFAGGLHTYASPT